MDLKSRKKSVRNGTLVEGREELMEMNVVDEDLIHIWRKG
jgi:hypothetical protein